MNSSGIPNISPKMANSFFEQIEKVQLEGMIAKRADSLYIRNGHAIG